MIKKMGYNWHLRQLMASQGMFQTTDLVPLLAERGVHLSREQVFRLVTQPPQRLSMDTLAALCDILGCGVEQLIEVVVVDQSVRKEVSGSGVVGKHPLQAILRISTAKRSRLNSSSIASKTRTCPWMFVPPDPLFSSTEYLSAGLFN